MKKGLLTLLVFLSSALAINAQQETDENRVEVFAGYSVQRIQTEQFSEFSRYAGLTLAQVQTNFGATPAQLDDGFDDVYRAGRNQNGINASLTYYFAKGLGITGDFAYHSVNQRRNTPNNPIFFEDYSRSKREISAFLAGPQYKFNRSSRVQPFARALVGVSRQKNRTGQFFGNPGNTNPGGIDQAIETTRLQDDFAALTIGGGGGLDIKITRRLALRVIQVDYLTVFSRSRNAELTVPNLTNQTNLGLTRFDNSRRGTVRFSFGGVFRW